MVCVGDIGEVVDGVEDVEAFGVDEVVAESGVFVGVGCYGWHYVGYACGCLGCLDRGVVCVKDAELVSVGVSEEGCTNSVVEAVDDLVKEIRCCWNCFIIRTPADVDVLDQPDRLVFFFCFKQVVD